MGQMDNPESRNPDGRFAPGMTGNPGGLPKWVSKAREAMRDELWPLAQRHLKTVLSGRLPHDATQEETALYASVTLEDRSTAAKLVLEYSIPKPKQAVGLKHSAGQGMEGVTVTIDMGGDSK